MFEIQKKAKMLETLRKRAQVSYGFYALGLLIAVVMAFAINIIWAAVIAALILFIYLIYGRNTVKNYREEYAKAKLENEMMGVLEKTEYQKKDLFSAGQLEQDHIFKMRPNTTVVRNGIRGKTASGIPAQLADIAFQIDVPTKEGKSVIRVLTGCYIRLQRQTNCNVDACIFEKEHTYFSVLQRYYEELGYHGTDWNSFCIYTSPDSELISEELRNRVAAIGKCSNHNEILRIYPDRVVAFLQGRFLNYGEPDFKHEVTIERLRASYLPEIKAVVSLLHVR